MFKAAVIIAIISFAVTDRARRRLPRHLLRRRAAGLS
jgi:hypothetical protein